MNKQDIIDAIASEVGLSKKDAKAALDVVLDSIAKGVKKDPVQLVGFGTFKVAKRAARMGVNPATGEKIKIKASKTVKFSVSKAIKEKL